MHDTGLRRRDAEWISNKFCEEFSLMWFWNAQGWRISYSPANRLRAKDHLFGRFSGATTLFQKNTTKKTQPLTLSWSLYQLVNFSRKNSTIYMLWKVCFLWLVVAKYLRCRRLWFKKTRFKNNLRVTRS